MIKVNQDFTALAGRILLSLLFLYSGIGKIMAPAATISYIAAAGLPLPQLAFIGAVIIELGFATALVLGYRVTFVALVMAGFTLLTGLAFHTDFAAKGQLINFLKNIAICGGLLQVLSFGAGAYSLDAYRARKAAIA